MMALALASPATREADAVLHEPSKQMKKSDERTSVRQCYPSDASMLHAQKADPDTLALREQLLLLQASGATALKRQGVSDERLRYLQLHTIDDDGLLRCSDINVHVYGVDGKRADQQDERHFN
jgi:hypothetical protein